MSSHFEDFLESLDKACTQAGRKLSELELLPVSKGQSVEKINTFLSLPGFPQKLAENYLEELASKEPQIPALEWHYQGALQSRKIEEILKHASYVQSVSRIKELQIIQKLASSKLKGFFLQINISSEGQKLGASENEALELLDFIHRESLDSSFAGFMGIASEVSDPSQESTVRKQFAYLREFRNKNAPSARLSMGMSSDFHWAIAEGADLIRVGSAIFGSRT